MNKLLFLLVSLLIFASCNEQEELFELTYEVDVVYNSTQNQFEAHFQDIFGIQTMIESFRVANNITEDQIKSIVPKEAQLVNILTDQGLDFIQFISIRVFDGSAFDPSDVTNVSEIFFRDNVPQDQRTFINLLPALPDVQDRLMEDQFNISIRSELRFPPPGTIEARLRITFVAQ